MKTWLLGRWDSLRGAFWFVPLLMAGGAVIVSLLTLMLDEATARQGEDFALPWTFSRGPEGSRAILATVAGSMLSIASVCFSITIVALQQASSQFGPRLLHNFMRDRGNQVVLGTLIASFTYCLLVLRAVNGTDDERFVPHLSVTVGLALGMAGVGVFIYFLHHAAMSIQAEHVIAAVSRELHAALDRLYPARVGRGPPGEGPKTLALPDGFEARAVAVPAGASGYLQTVDSDRVMGLAVEHDLVLVLDYRPGQFVFEGTPLARVWPAGRVAEEVSPALRSAFSLGSRRTLLQDVEFAIDQLVEIAVRALSPGINDPFTAIACVDRLAAGVADFAGRDVPSPSRVDDAGRLRVVANGVTPEGVAGSTFHQIRQAARGNAAVTLRLLDVITAIAPQVRTAALRHALLTHAALIHQGGEATLAPADRAEADRRHKAAVAALAEPAPA